MLVQGETLPCWCGHLIDAHATVDAEFPFIPDKKIRRRTGTCLAVEYCSCESYRSSSLPVGTYVQIGSPYDGYEICGYRDGGMVRECSFCGNTILNDQPRYSIKIFDFEPDYWDERWYEDTVDTGAQSVPVNVCCLCVEAEWQMQPEDPTEIELE